MKHYFSRKGAAAVEFALILPLLLVVLFGIIEFSILMYDKQMITNASREGARQGIVFRADATTGDYDPFTVPEIEAVVNNYLQNSLINFVSNSHNTVVTGGGASGQLLNVTVNYTYSFLGLPSLLPLPFVEGGIPLTIGLSATTAMRME
jgi:Flp pilus assembly protein TadG